MIVQGAPNLSRAEYQYLGFPILAFVMFLRQIMMK